MNTKILFLYINDGLEENAENTNLKSKGFENYVSSEAWVITCTNFVT